MTSHRSTELGRIGAHRTRGGLRVRAHWANRPEETRRAQGLRREDRICRADAAKLAIRNFRDLIPGVADGERVVGQNWISHGGKKTARSVRDCAALSERGRGVKQVTCESGHCSRRRWPYDSGHRKDLRRRSGDH